jgi:putative transposase
VLRQRWRELARVRTRYGSQRRYILLRQQGWPDNHKRVHRLYCLEGLNLRSKRPRRKRAAARRLEQLPMSRLQQGWNINFVANHLFDDRKIRALTIVDNFSRQYGTIHVGQSL